MGPITSSKNKLNSLEKIDFLSQCQTQPKYRLVDDLIINCLKKNSCNSSFLDKVETLFYML